MNRVKNSTIHLILNPNPVDTYEENQLSYGLDTDLSIYLWNSWGQDVKISYLKVTSLLF